MFEIIYITGFIVCGILSSVIIFKYLDIDPDPPITILLVGVMTIMCALIWPFLLVGTLFIIIGQWINKKLAP